MGNFSGLLGHLREKITLILNVQQTSQSQITDDLRLTSSLAHFLSGEASQGSEVQTFKIQRNVCFHLI